ncbi:MAG: folate-binding protein YgfZ [Rhizobiales bacterium]|nr:folate-binding protein YgfZ [Hyphomicrobiales bacterium]MBN8984350.1 folate-binding protein YgfZ [Hyphomicrobiales bacterium]
MDAALLSNRGVIKLSGEDAKTFLNGLITTDTTKLEPGAGRFGALLTPQGKIVADFLITEVPVGHGGGLLIDCPRALAQPLATKLGFYKLRAKVSVENLSDAFGILAVWGGEPAVKPDLCFADPRAEDLGWRILIPPELAAKTATLVGAKMTDEAAYEAHRIACGVPRGGVDFNYGDAFPHETNMDHLHGVDFDKGCYVGQEVVSRMQHRGTARTRTVRVTFDGGAPDASVPILANDKQVGTMGSSAHNSGLATVRIDKVSDALDAGTPLMAGNVAIHLTDPDAVRGLQKKTVA